ncbi:MAG: hypothetical protein ACTSPB_00070 [Candidatus Thorarchaeota archaeon]
MKEEAEIIVNKSCVCPFCGSLNIEGDRLFVDNLVVKCMCCKKSFTVVDSNQSDGDVYHYENGGCMKVFHAPIQGTVVCHWCGLTNHALPKRAYVRIDGIMGCCTCWNTIKSALVFMKLIDKDSEARLTFKVLEEMRLKQESIL